MKKILILANHETTIFNFRRELIKNLVDNNYEVIVSFPKETDKTDKIVELGCKHIDLNLQRQGTNPINDLKLMLEYNKIIKQISPDVVLTYTVKPNIYGGIICRMRKVPYISTVTGLGAIAKKSIFQRALLFLLRLSLEKASKVFFQNQANIDFFKNNKFKLDNSILIPGSGVNLEINKFEQYPKESEKIKFVNVSRLSKEKGHYELMEAIEKINNPDIEFHFIGWSEDEECEKKVRELSEKKLIVYHGSLSPNEVHEVEKKCHCLIHPSYHEGLSNVCLEAAACGRAVLASDIPGCREIVEHSKNGYLFKPESVEAIIDAINSFLELSYDKQKELGIYGRKKVEKEFDRNIVINIYSDEIKNIIMGVER